MTRWVNFSGLVTHSCRGKLVRLFGAKPFSRPMQNYQYNHIEKYYGSNSVKFDMFQNALEVIISRCPFYLYGLTLTLAWISNHMPSKVCVDIIYPIPNFNGATVEVWEWKSNFVLHFMADIITCPCWD